MRGKILLVVGLGVGYVLGARAGRGRYDEIVAKVQGIWNDPRVQKQVNNAGEFVKEKAPGVADFVATNVKKPSSSTPASSSTRSSSTTSKPAARKPGTSGSTTAKS
jgi:hypothetical protein